MSATARFELNRFCRVKKNRIAEIDTYGHECGQPSTWLGAQHGHVLPGGAFVLGFCDTCQQDSREAETITHWERISP